MGLPLPPYGTQLDVSFNNTPVDVVVVKTEGSVKHYIEWNNLSQMGQQNLIDLIDFYGGTLPLPPTAGHQTIDLGGTAVGGDPTGLGTVGGSPTYAVLDFNGSLTSSTVVFPYPRPPVYFHLQINNTVGPKIEFRPLGGETWADVEAFLVPELAAKYSGMTIDITTNPGNITVTRGANAFELILLIEGVPSFLRDMPGRGLKDILIQGHANKPAKVGTAATCIDDAIVNVTIDGDDATTFTDFINELNTGFAGAATATLEGGNIKVTSTTVPTGPNTISNVVLNKSVGSLFQHLNGFNGYTPVCAGIFDFHDALEMNFKGNGQKYTEAFMVQERDDVPVMPEAPFSRDLCYYDGTDWVPLVVVSDPP